MTAHARPDSNGISRRSFARLLAAGGSAALLGRTGLAFERPAPLPQTPAAPDEEFWRSVREQFLMPMDVSVMNAANLCPSSLPVIEAMYENTKDIDRDASFQNRGKMSAGKINTRKLLAEFLHTTPEQIVITRNTSEANNLVSSGVELTADDEVIIFNQNHPSNNTAWKEKAKRYGFTVTELEVVSPHPGADYYVDLVRRSITGRTKLVAITHHTNTVGDLFPAKEICRVARDRGVLSLVDGAQSFGLMDVDLSDMQPDFYSGSAHKWPCGPKETGVLFVNERAHDQIWGTIFSAGRGDVGISQKLESFGQRDEPAIIAFGEALKFQQRIGMKTIQARSQELAQSLMEQVSAIDGVTLSTSQDSTRSVAVVVFAIDGLDGRGLFNALYENEQIGVTGRGNGLRISPHFYNLHSEIDRTVAAIKRYKATGV
ncbi:MAG: aminotransferase class V-fold PLP-dependent enzyme [Vicinamibacterales bacterium]|nr:aminotransferase class V-fold PLP-dependent enzyme [Vicinamibacterales bacterium]MDP7671693.1 aminotransferase class V-fold PLP-dependent enzyme [Vicinamibacterales bacterium]HJO39156.1 aminotransferase class V-fold PLP-dependent enzyme [Vicinamibacterales bacterium]